MPETTKYSWMVIIFCTGLEGDCFIIITGYIIPKRNKKKNRPDCSLRNLLYYCYSLLQSVNR